MRLAQAVESWLAVPIVAMQQFEHVILDILHGLTYEILGHKVSTYRQIERYPEPQRQGSLVLLQEGCNPCGIRQGTRHGTHHGTRRGIGTVPRNTYVSRTSKAGSLFCYSYYAILTSTPNDCWNNSCSGHNGTLCLATRCFALCYTQTAYSACLLGDKDLRKASSTNPDIYMGPVSVKLRIIK